MSRTSAEIAGLQSRYCETFRRRLGNVVTFDRQQVYVGLGCNHIFHVESEPEVSALHALRRDAWHYGLVRSG